MVDPRWATGWGIPPERVHAAVAVDAGGRRIGNPVTVNNDASSIAVLLAWIQSITDGELRA